MKEEIREGITKIVEHYAEAMQTDGEQYPEFIAVDRILAHLKSKGVVIKTGGEWCIQHGYPIPCYKCGAKHGQAAVEDLI